MGSQTVAQTISMLDARMHAVRSRLPGQTGTSVALLSAAVNNLEAGLVPAMGVIRDAENARDPQLSVAMNKHAEGTTVVGLGQAGIITLTRQASGTTTPDVVPGTTPATGGGGGSRGGGPIVTQTPPPTEPTVWAQLFPEGAPWYQQPGYLIGGAVVLGGAAVALSIMSKKRQAPKPAAQEA